MSMYYKNIIILLVFLVIFTIIYFGFQDNYFFSDDFEWLSRSIMSQAKPLESFKVVGRDFNPVFIVFTSIFVKFFGLKPLFFRLFALLIFVLTLFLLYLIMKKYLKINYLIALSAAIIFGANVYISEILLNYSAYVYLFALFFILLAFIFYFEKKKILYLIFLFLAFLSKEIIILFCLPFLFLEKKNKNRLFILGSFFSLILLRVVIQLGSTSNYSSFISFKNYIYKFYFIIIRCLNLSPYTIHPIFGIVIIIIMLALFFFIRKVHGMRFAFSAFFIYSLFFALFPKLSSRYYFLPCAGLIICFALLFNELNRKKPQITKLGLALLVLTSLSINYSAIKKEIKDYSILGGFSKNFILKHKSMLKKVDPSNKKLSVKFYKRPYTPLMKVYKRVEKRKTIPKLLSLRKDSIGGVIEPSDFIPIVFYPDFIVEWKTEKENNLYYTGKFHIILSRDKNEKKHP